MNQSINADSKNNKEPQQKYRLGTVSIKILGGLNRFYRRLTSPSASIMAQNIPTNWMEYLENLYHRHQQLLPTRPLKHSNLTKTMFYRLSKDWLLFTFPMFKPQLQSNTCLHRYLRFETIRKKPNGQ